MKMILDAPARWMPSVIRFVAVVSSPILSLAVSTSPV
jgi:hypothetical protein